MKRTDDVIKFITSLNSGSLGHKLQGVIDNDVEMLDGVIVNKILCGQFKVDGGWSAYTLSDVDILYDEDMLHFSDRLDMFGIRKSVPPIRANDKGLVIIYRFTLYDIFGGDLDSLAAYHVAIRQTSISPIPVEKFIVAYDQ